VTEGAPGRFIGGGLAAAAVLVVVWFLARDRLATRVGGVRANVAGAMRQLSAEADSAASGVGTQRYRKQREAVAAMRADLRKLVVVESVFMADSQRQAPWQRARYPYPPSPGVVGPTIVATGDGWWAWMSSSRTPIVCAVSVRTDSVPPWPGPDTLFRVGRSGDPMCMNGSTWDDFSRRRFK
jgi:hypothetical protein